MHSEIDLYCRVCGYKSDEPPWGDDGRSPLFDFCACCGVEHGYQDSTPQGARTYRAEWLAGGANWEQPSEKQIGWSLDDQLRDVPAEFR
jgi:hypothetical protein